MPINGNFDWTDLRHLSSELQITEGIEDNSKIIFLISQQNICCDPSLELCRGDSSNDGSQNMFLWRNVANYPSIIPVPLLSGVLLSWV